MIIKNINKLSEVKNSCKDICITAVYFLNYKGKIYTGATKDLYKRLLLHRALLKNNKGVHSLIDGDDIDEVKVSYIIMTEDDDLLGIEEVFIETYTIEGVSVNNQNPIAKRRELREKKLIIEKRKKERLDDLVKKGEQRRLDRERLPNKTPSIMLGGEGNIGAKLTGADVLSIRSEREQKGTSILGLSRAYGVSATTIQSVVARKSWKHI